MTVTLPGTVTEPGLGARTRHTDTKQGNGVDACCDPCACAWSCSVNREPWPGPVTVSVTVSVYSAASDGHEIRRRQHLEVVLIHLQIRQYVKACRLESLVQGHSVLMASDASTACSKGYQIV